jgi:hypothetical protein
MKSRELTALIGIQALTAGFLVHLLFPPVATVVLADINGLSRLWNRIALLCN